MITVRFPSGFSVQYNDANFIERHSEYSDLRRKKDGEFLVQVPNSALIETVFPCRTYNADEQELVANVVALRKELVLAQKEIKRLKKEAVNA